MYSVTFAPLVLNMPARLNPSKIYNMTYTNKALNFISNKILQI